MDKTATFEQAMARLDEITTLLDSGGLELEESLTLFSEGVELINYCNKKLENAKLKIETLFPETNAKEVD